jgi:hypothetical protein
VVNHPWWRCKCGHSLTEHGARRNESQSGLTYDRCRDRDCICDKFVNESDCDFYDGSLRKLWKPDREGVAA